MSSPTPSDSTIILGGGIIGLSTAYYLSLQRPTLARDNKIHILDSAPSLFLSASGYAGGFIAKDWFSPAAASLGALSFQLHNELANAHDGCRKWSYSESTAYSLSIDEIGVGGKPSGKKIKGKDWLLEGTSRADVAQPTKSSDGDTIVENGNGANMNEMLNRDGTPAWMTKQEGGTLERISSEHGCAQVQPKELCEWLLSEVESRGVQVHLSSKVTGTSKDETGKIQGLTVREGDTDTTITLPCKNIVIATGAWTTKTFRILFPTSKTRIGIGPLAGYSITVRSPRYSTPILDPSKHTKDGDTGMCHSVFCAPGPNWSHAPEAISRVTRSGKPEIYVGGVNDANMPLPPDATGVEDLFDKEKARELRRTAVLLTGLSNEGDELVDDDLEIVREALCMRPVSDSGKPVVTKVQPKQLGQGVEMRDGEGGVFVASGHGPWGISMSLGTGLVMSELLQGKKTSADIKGLGLR